MCVRRHWLRTQHFDAIIGAGQAGPSLAGRLTATGMKVALVERNLFGGTCVNTGCMPTKTLVASAYAAHLARRSAEYGIAMESPVRIDMRRVKARADTVSTNARTNVEKWLRGMDGLTVVEGHARFTGPDVVQVGDFSQGIVAKQDPKPAIGGKREKVSGSRGR